MHFSLESIGISTSLLGWEHIPKLPCYDHRQGLIAQPWKKGAIKRFTDAVASWEQRRAGHCRRGMPRGASQPRRDEASPFRPALGVPKSKRSSGNSPPAHTNTKPLCFAFPEDSPIALPWMNKFNYIINWHQLEEKHELSNRVLAQDPFAVTARGGQNCSAVASRL